MHQPDMNR